MERLDKAVALRNEGRFKESNDIILALVEENPEDAYINYQCAWSFDVLGEEAKAIPYYEKSIALGLEGEDLEGSFLGLGSTYRTLGEYEKSFSVLKKGVEMFPENKAISTFYAMTLYNLEKYDESIKILLLNLSKTSIDKNVERYSKAIEFYADKLDIIWK